MGPSSVSSLDGGAREAKHSRPLAHGYSFATSVTNCAKVQTLARFCGPRFGSEESISDQHRVSCAEPVLKRRRRYCETCLPQARRERGLRAIEVARKALATQAAAGEDPRASAHAGH